MDATAFAPRWLVAPCLMSSKSIRNLCNLSREQNSVLVPLLGKIMKICLETIGTMVLSVGESD